jgi:5-methylcytosine-specific restriction endonuclease McrA
MILKNCRFCTKEFLAKSKTIVYCSKYCREQYDIELKQNRNYGRFEIFERDKFKCCYCGRTPYEDNIKLVIEHIYPRFKGGSNNLYNVITSCHECNLEKYGRIIQIDIIKSLWKRNEKLNSKYSNKQKQEIFISLQNIFPDAIIQKHFGELLNLKLF